MRKNLPFLAMGLILVGLDQASKALVAAQVGLHQSVPVIKGFFAIAPIQNRGAILGIFNASGSRLVPVALGLLSFAAMALIGAYFLKTPASEKLVRTAFAFIMTGALGNLIDRAVRGYVIDFLEMHIGRFYWPTYNVADACISIGAVLLVFAVFIRRKPA